MVSKLNHLLSAVIVSILFLIQCSISSPMENDKMAELIERLDRMQTMIEAQEDKFKLQNSLRDKEILELKKQISKLESLLPTKSAPISPHPHKNGGPTLRASTPPASCADMTGVAALANNNDDMDGIYLIQNKDTRKIEAVFCQFSTNPISQNVIGRVDVQSKPVHFSVWRTSPTNAKNTVLTFDVALLNEGGAFDVSSGIFTAPVKGIYHFHFSGNKEFRTYKLEVQLQVNGAEAGWASFEQADNGSTETVSLSLSYRLQAGDKVNLYLNEGILVDTEIRHQTHFSGWLAEEDLI